MAGVGELSLLNPLAVALIDAAGLLVVVAVAIRNTLRDKLASTFVIMGGLMFAWINFAYLARVMGAENIFWAEMFLRLAWVATPPFFAYVYLITVHMLRKAKQLASLNITLVVIALLLSAATAFTDFIIEGVTFSGPNLDIIYGKGFLPFLGVISLYIVATLLPIFTAKLEDHRKRRVRIFLTGVLIFYIANLIFNITLPVFLGVTRLYYLGDYSLLFLVGLTAYAIVRHRLLDIKTIIFRAVAFAFLIGVFFVAYGFAMFWMLRSLERFALSAPALAILSAVSVALAIPAYRLYHRLLGNATDRFLFQNRANYRRALVEYSEALSGTIQITEVTSTVLQAMREIVRTKKTIILLRSPEGNVFEPRAQAGVKHFRVEIQPDNVLLEHLRHQGKLIVKDELLTQREQELSPSHREELRVVEDGLRWLDVSVVVPLFVNKELTGIILLGDKLSGEPYLQDDVEFLSAFAPQAATALENARLYLESLEFGRRLQREVEQATRELAVANEQLKELDQAKSEFLSIASHQLYTPLTAIRGYLSMVREGDFGKIPAKQQPVMDILEKSATRLIELIKNLLDISRIEAGRLELNLESIDVAAMAKELVQDLMPNAMAKGLKLMFEPPAPSLPHVVADRDRIRQVVLNFIDNAIKYTERGHVTVTVKPEGDQVVLAVADTGKGMTRDEIAKLFKKFSRVGGADRFHTEGTGLGLYVAKQIVKEHHGDVTVSSPGTGKGSVFSMRLPAEGTPGALKVGGKATVEIKAAEVQKAEDEKPRPQGTTPAPEGARA